MVPRQPLTRGVGSERAQHFLKVLVERYLRDGQPVGSRTLAKDSKLDLSPATIRNVMADLEDMGLVISPHTSAGRIPTATGIRMFVDSLLTIKPVDEIDVERIRDKLGTERSASEMLASVSNVLSGITHMAGIVTLPRHEPNAFKQIEFVGLSERRLLVILVTSDGEVHNRIVHTDRDHAHDELRTASNYLNGWLIGQDMREVRERLIKEMLETKESMDRVMRQAVEMAGELLSDTEEHEDFLISGQTNLMEFGELATVERLRRLFDAFTEKHEILHLLDKCMRADGVQIFIGEESGYELLEECSVVTAPYRIDDKVVGVLGVIGPTRMAYDRVIPIVDITAKLLGAALKNR